VNKQFSILNKLSFDNISYSYFISINDISWSWIEFAFISTIDNLINEVIAGYELINPLEIVDYDSKSLVISQSSIFNSILLPLFLFYSLPINFIMLFYSFLEDRVKSIFFIKIS
jgi:hypothetical protein